MYMIKVDNKNTRAKCETCLKLKLKNKYTRMTLSNGVRLSLLLEIVSYHCSWLSIIDFECLNDGWECCVCILMIAIHVTIKVI